MTSAGQKRQSRQKKESFFLPDGTCTSSTHKYVSEWRRLAKDVGTPMGLVAHSWDPDLAMVPATGPVCTPIIIPRVVALRMQTMQKRINELEYWTNLQMKCNQTQKGPSNGT